MSHAPFPEDEPDFLPSRPDESIQRGDLEGEFVGDIDPRLERWLHALGEELAQSSEHGIVPTSVPAPDSALSDDTDADTSDETSEESFIGGAELAHLEQLVRQARPATRPGSVFRLRVISEAGRVHRAAMREFGPVWDQIRSADSAAPTTMAIRWWHLSADGGASRFARKGFWGRASVVACLLLMVLASGYPFSAVGGLGDVPVVGRMLPTWMAPAWTDPPAVTLSLAQVRPVWRGESNPPPQATADDWALVSSELEFRRMVSLGFATMALAD